MPFYMEDVLDSNNNVVEKGAITLLRERLGNPLTFEIADDSLKSAINSAVKEYSKFRPRREVIELPLESGKEFYDLSSGVIAVLDCILSFNKGNTNSYYGSPEFLHNHYPPHSQYVTGGRSIDFIEELEQDRINRFDGYEWDYFPSTNQIRITPAPDFNGVTKTMLAYMFDPTTFPTRDFELMMKYALGEGMEILGNFRTKVKEIPTGVGYKMTLDGGETLLQNAPKKKQEFYDELKSGGTWIVTG